MEVEIRNPQFMERLNEISDEFFSHENYMQKDYWTFREEDDIHKGYCVCYQNK